MQKLTTLLSFLCPLFIFAQDCDPTFYYFDGGPPTNNRQTSVALSSDGGYMLAGSVAPGGSGPADIRVIRVDPLGLPIWSKTYGTADNEREKMITRLADGNFLILSNRKTNNKSSIYLLKIDPDGNTIWEQTFAETSRGLFGECVVEAEQSRLVIAAWTGDEYDSDQMVFMKLSPQGNLLLKKFFNPPIATWGPDYDAWPTTNPRSSAYSVTVLADGNYMFTGVSIPELNIIPSPTNMLVYKTDLNLNVLWNKDFYDNDFCYPGNAGRSIVQAPDGFVYIACQKYGYCLDGGSPRFSIYKFNLQGDTLWNKKVGPECNGAAEIITTSDGNFAITDNNHILMKMNPDGEMLWYTTFFGPGFYPVLGQKSSIKELPSGGFVLAGDIYRNGGPEQFLVITDADGNSCKSQLSGVVYYDQNNNCQYDVGLDPLLPNAFVELSPSTGYAFSHSDGSYGFIVDTGSYHLNAIPPNALWDPLCPASGGLDVSLPVPYQFSDSLNFGFSPVNICPVIQHYGSQSTSRVCREGEYTLNLCNYGSAPADSMLIKLVWPAEFEILGINFPYTQSGDTLLITMSGLDIGECKTLIVKNSVKCDATLGALACFNVRFDVAPGCSSYDYVKIDEHCLTIRNSYDPNDKRGLVSNKYDCFNAADLSPEKLFYQIRFQNTGNDTAYRVVIIDTLDTDIFDLESLKQGPSSHPYELLVRGANILVWVFQDINLSDSLSNPAASQGYLNFSINSRNPLGAADEINNRAAIYFDANPPIFTPWSSLVSCTGSNTGSPAEAIETFDLFPNPANERVSLLFSGPGKRVLSLYSGDGSLVQQPVLLYKNLEEVNLSQMPAGLYWVKIESAEGVGFRKLILAK